MKLIISILLFSLIPLLVFPQEIEQEKDSIATIENPYIEDHSDQLNIKIDVTKDEIKYFIPFDDEKAAIQTNLKTSYGLVFSYKFLSIRLGIRPSLSNSEKENKGETDFFRFRVKLLFDKWTHRLEYNYTRGFYIKNTQEIAITTSNPNFHIQFPRLTTNIITGYSQYNFNDNYSFKSIESNTEIQLKSAGSFVIGLNYTFYNAEGSDYLIQEGGEIINRTDYHDYKGFNTILNAGYYYTFVFNKFWYLNAYAKPGIAIDFYHSTFHSENNSNVEKKHNEAFFFLNTGFAAGYNGRKYYFGIEYNYAANSEKFDSDNISLQPIKNSFHVFIGYRFKAPKQVTKPVDLIEEKVPILNDNNN